MKSLEIKHLKLSVSNNIVLDKFSLSVPSGEIHALVGKNGTGKSSLAKAIAGHTSYKILEGDISIDGQSIIGKSPDEIAKLGFFLAFQNPIEIPGVSVANFIRAAMQSKLSSDTKFNAIEFYKELYEKMNFLQIDKSFSSRSLNDGFSGGEKKRFEVLQMLMLQPKYAIFDETDSGLDIDALKIVANAINSMRGNDFGAIIITHHNKLLEYVNVDAVHVLSDRKISMSGGPGIIDKLEKFGYDALDEQHNGLDEQCEVLDKSLKN